MLSNDHFPITKDLIVKIKGNVVETGSIYALVRTSFKMHSAAKLRQNFHYFVRNPGLCHPFIELSKHNAAII